MRAALTSIFLALTGCSNATPELANGLPENIEEANGEFDSRVKERFALGMAEVDLVRELRNQGFERLPSSRGIEDATFYRKNFPFVTLWSVRWKSENGKVTEVWGVHGVRGP